MVRTVGIRSRIAWAFLVIIFLLGVCVSGLGYFIIQRYIVEKTQKEVQSGMKAVRTVYRQKISKLKLAFDVVNADQDLERFKASASLDYVRRIPGDQAAAMTDPVVSEALRTKTTVAGSRIIDEGELATLGPDFASKYSLPIIKTEKAHPTTKTVLKSVMSIECARPFYDDSGKLVSVLNGGRILNRNTELIELMSESVFDRQFYRSEPVETMTVFQDDVRIATTVLDRDGRPAIGTLISATVYDRVIKEGKAWLDRAFVVRDWYLTAYEPIRAIDGKVIGALYLGLLEKPFVEMGNRILLGFLGMIASALLVAGIVSFFLSGSICKPLDRMMNMVKKISAGDLTGKITEPTSVSELNLLIREFNEMSVKLDEREKNLEESNQKLAKLNKNYLDLISFVTHELKGILSSMTLNTYAVRDGHLGTVNIKQRKALDSVTRNTDHLTSTVNNFLNLSRLEKGELVVRKTNLRLKEDILHEVISNFCEPALLKEMSIDSDIDSQLTVSGDLDLLKVVANNLVGNAVKYGKVAGQVKISAKDLGDRVEVSVYNDGEPIPEESRDKLFRKFSRVVTGSSRHEKGTGLGLYITKEIVERHGGCVRVEALEGGNRFLFTIPKS